MDAKEAIEQFNKYKNAGFNNYAQPKGEAIMLAFEALEKVEALEAENARLQKYNDTLIADNNLLRNDLDAQDLLAHEDDIEFAEMEHL